MQAELFALDVITEERASGTADLKLTGFASDHFKYAIKTQQDHPDLPVSEWFCYKLSEMVHLPTPVCKVLRMRDGSFAFGSRWENAGFQYGTVKDTYGQEPWGLFAAKNLSSIIGLDHFLPNPDRHMNNLLFQSFDKHITAMSFDFSRAWLMAGFPDSDCKLPTECNTSITLNIMKSLEKFIKDEAAATLHKVSEIQGSGVRRIFETMPSSWFDEERLDDFVKWWDSDSRLARLERSLQVLQA